MTAAAPSFNAALHPEVHAERRRALRALLRQPLLHAGGETAEEFQLVRRHCGWLDHWLAQYPSWSLHIHRDFARLRKLPADLYDRTRPAIDSSSGAVFTRRRYALFCLALTVLEQSDRQTTLGRIAHSIRELVASDRHLQAAGLDFDMAHHDQRRDLIHAIRLLMDTGVLSLLDGPDGKAKQSLNGSESADALYSIHRQVLADLLQVARSPSAVESAFAAAMQEKDAPAQKPLTMTLTERCEKLQTQDESNANSATLQRIRARLVRALLDDPILYFHDLDQDERNYFEKNRGLIFRQIQEATGLVAEHRAEGVAMVDDMANLTDLHLAEENSFDSLHLYLVQWLADCLKNGAEMPIGVSRVEEQIREWQADISDTAAAQRTADALLHLQSLRLIRMTPGGIVPLAAVGRWFNNGSSERGVRFAHA